MGLLSSTFAMGQMIQSPLTIKILLLGATLIGGESRTRRRVVWEQGKRNIHWRVRTLTDSPPVNGKRFAHWAHTWQSHADNFARKCHHCRVSFLSSLCGCRCCCNHRHREGITPSVNNHKCSQQQELLPRSFRVFLLFSIPFLNHDPWSLTNKIVCL